MHRIIPLLIIIFLASCATTSKPKSNTAPTGEKDSPSSVVINFIDSIKAKDFGSAYKYIHSPSTDKEGFIAVWKYYIENSDNKINNYKLIGTRIVGDTSYIIIEIELSTDTAEQNLRYTKNQYVLKLIKNKWKIVSDECIANCIETEKAK